MIHYNNIGTLLCERLCTKERRKKKTTVNGIVLYPYALWGDIQFDGYVTRRNGGCNKARSRSAPLPFVAGFRPVPRAPSLSLSLSVAQLKITARGSSSSVSRNHPCRGKQQQQRKGQTPCWELLFNTSWYHSTYHTQAQASSIPSNERTNADIIIGGDVYYKDSPFIPPLASTCGIL